MGALREHALGDDGAVIAKALGRASERLGLTQSQLGPILGVSEASISRLLRGGSLDPDGKPFELALLFLRLYRSLAAILADDQDAMRSWLRSENRALGFRPIDRLSSVTGLVATVQYVDALRARV